MYSICDDRLRKMPGPYLNLQLHRDFEHTPGLSMMPRAGRARLNHTGFIFDSKNQEHLVQFAKFCHVLRLYYRVRPDCSTRLIRLPKAGAYTTDSLCHTVCHAIEEALISISPGPIYDWVSLASLGMRYRGPSEGQVVRRFMITSTKVE